MKVKNELKELQPGGAATYLSSLPNGSQVIDVASMRNREVDLKVFALAYDSGPAQGVLNYSHTDSTGWSTIKTFYANFGYRVDQLTPYISYSSQRTARNFIDTSVPAAYATPLTTQLNQAALLTQANIKTNQAIIALGTRYDFARNMALKFQIDHIRYQDPESLIDPSLSTSDVVNRGYKALTLYSLALDFIF
jgi:hypothetical protein